MSCVQDGEVIAVVGLVSIVRQSERFRTPRKTSIQITIDIRTSTISTHSIAATYDLFGSASDSSMWLLLGSPALSIEPAPPNIDSSFSHTRIEVASIT